MNLDLNAAEVEMLAKVLESAHRERLLQIHRSDSREYRKHLEQEASLLQAVRARLMGQERHRRDEIVDESVEESFPASDSPARSGASRRGDSRPG